MVHIKKGELTQEEKELLEVIGKGVGAGLRRGLCLPGRGREGGAWPSPCRAPGPADPRLWFSDTREYSGGLGFVGLFFFTERKGFVYFPSSEQMP